MKAILTERKQKFINSFRKNSINASYILIDSKCNELIELRLYYPARTCYACLWVDSHGISGTGSSGGGNYHNESAATGEAIYNAGFDLSKKIHGRGNEAIEEALFAISKVITKKKCKLFKTNP